VRAVGLLSIACLIAQISDSVAPSSQAAYKRSITSTRCPCCLIQIARAANQGQLVTSPGRNDIKEMLRVCEALRDHLKGLLMANAKSRGRGSD